MHTHREYTVSSREGILRPTGDRDNTIFKTSQSSTPAYALLRFYTGDLDFFQTKGRDEKND